MRLRSDTFWQRVFRTRADDTLPHTVAHQRIYIVPTKRGAAFLVALLLMLIASVNYALSLGYALCFLLTGLFAATLLHTYRNLAGLIVTRMTSSDGFAGEPVPFLICLSNERNEPRHGVRLQTRDGHDVRLRVDANEQTQAQLNVPTQTRGICKLGRLTLQSDWPLGLWTCWSYLHVPVQGIIFPQPEDNPPPLPSHTESTAGDQRKAGRQGDVSGLREYVPGDSIGAIAWKSAARGTGLQVRTFDAEHAAANAVLNLHTTGKHHLEEQLARLCAWVLQAERARTDYALELPGNRIDTGGGQEHRNSVLTALALHGIQS